MYGIFTYFWVIFRANVGKYCIHGAYGHGNPMAWESDCIPGRTEPLWLQGEDGGKIVGDLIAWTFDHIYPLVNIQKAIENGHL
jgi:hypothetical protein